MTLKTLDQILINSEKEIRMSQFKHKPNTGSLFYQEDNKGSPKPNWKGKIVIDDDVSPVTTDPCSLATTIQKTYPNPNPNIPSKKRKRALLPTFKIYSPFGLFLT